MSRQHSMVWGGAVICALAVLLALFVVSPLWLRDETVNADVEMPVGTPPALPPAPNRMSRRSMVAAYDHLPTTMNPLYALSMADHRAHELVFDRLFFRSPITNDVSSRLADAHYLSDDGRAVVVDVAHGVQWHDGELFGADDICFTVQTMLDLTTGSTSVDAFREAIVGCDVSEQNTRATIALRRAYPDAYDRLGFSVLPRHAFDGRVVSPDHDFSHRPVGTGPMQGSKGTRGVRFVASPARQATASIPVLHLMRAGDPFVQLRTLQAAGVQGVVTVPPAFRPEITASDDVALKSYDLRSWWFIALNTTRSPLDNALVRRALDRSIDRSQLRQLTVGHEPNDPSPPCEFISGPFVQSSPYYNRAIAPQATADLPSAESLMLRAGATRIAGTWRFAGQPITLNIGMASALGVEAHDLLNQVGNQVRAAGFEQMVRHVDSDTWTTQAVTGQWVDDFDMLIGKWSFGAAEDVNSLFHTRTADGEGEQNIFHYSNPEVDRILEQYERASTDVEAQDAYHQLHAVLAEDLPYIFLWSLNTKSAWRNDIRGNTITPYYYFTTFDGWRWDEEAAP